ncbi:hypothetical protein OUZ56_027417 [Daphnia magna]|uniref:Uncharacterized protein n=1 Tax=Daphnia magna TaxID=35525 RepID=A0ABQ9ZQ24_9CRUS|nr:hypothetical protein OUZ56_027417 [Daphnia magna]
MEQQANADLAVSIFNGFSSFSCCRVTRESQGRRHVGLQSQCRTIFHFFFEKKKEDGTTAHEENEPKWPNRDNPALNNFYSRNEMDKFFLFIPRP